jgi:hypothetical protein
MKKFLRMSQLHYVDDRLFTYPCKFCKSTRESRFLTYIQPYGICTCCFVAHIHCWTEYLQQNEHDRVRCPKCFHRFGTEPIQSSVGTKTSEPVETPKPSFWRRFLYLVQRQPPKEKIVDFDDSGEKQPSTT